MAKSLMKQVIFKLKVVYNDNDYDDDDDGDKKPFAITKHEGQPGNEYAQSISTMDVFPML